MTLPSDPPLPPWPYYLAGARHYPVDEAYVVALEARLHLAVEALERASTDDAASDINEFARVALALIGPLPESQEGDTK